MTSTIPVGSDVSSGTYRCASCNYELGIQSVESLPPCPKCDGPYAWEAVSGGDAAADPYPGQS
jgi:Zn finger protein HypA/HybF involved in hydrogenase expression